MTRTEQAKFVRCLTTSVADGLIANLKANPSTKDWDGHELRVRLSEIFYNEAGHTLIKSEPRSARSMAYRNTVVTTNI